jgi:GMP synthase (glutamine-hydrolysing)
VQFHPEVVHSEHGAEILRNFLFRICGARPDWTPESFVETAIARLAAQAPEGQVICALSGGVDSTVAAALLHRAIGSRLKCIFVDTGLLRAGDRAMVEGPSFPGSTSGRSTPDRFFAALGGSGIPRKQAIGKAFIDVFERRPPTSTTSTSSRKGRSTRT